MKKKLILAALPALLALCAFAGCDDGNGGDKKDPVIPDSGEFDITKATITGALDEVTAELGTRYTVPVPEVEYNGTKREVTFEVLDGEEAAVELIARGTRFYVDSMEDYTINYFITYLGESKLIASSAVSVVDTKGPEILLPASAYSMTVYKDSTVNIPVPTIRDGSGVVVSSGVKVTFKGQTVSIAEGAEGELGSFVPTEFGNYTIEYTAKDGSDNESIETVTVNCARMITLCDFEDLEKAQVGTGSLTTEHAYSGNALKIENATGLWLTLKVYPEYYNLAGFDRLQIHVWASRACESGMEGFFLLNQRFTLQEGDNIITIDKKTLNSQYKDGLIPSANPSYSGADYLWFQPYGVGVTFVVDNLVGIFDSFDEDTVAPTIDFGRELQLELTKNEGLLYVNENKPVTVPTEGLKAYDNSIEAVAGGIDYTVKVKGGSDITDQVKAGAYLAKDGEEYVVTYKATDVNGNTGTRTITIKTRVIQLPAGNDLPAGRDYDVLQDFDAEGGVTFTGNSLTKECGEQYARRDNAISLAPAGADAAEFKIKLLKESAVLTVADFQAYRYFQLSVVCNSDKATLKLGSKEFALSYGLNLIQLWGTDFVAQIKAGMYDAEGWLSCSIKGAESKIFLDDFVAVKAATVEEPDYQYKELQSFDVQTSQFGEAGGKVNGTGTAYAVKDFAMSFTINPGTATFLMPLLKDGKVMTLAQLKAFDYFEFSVYSEKSDVGIYFFKTRIATLNQGENTVHMSGADFVKVIEEDDGSWFPAYNFTNGQSAWQLGAAGGATIYLDHFIGVYPDGYVEPEEPEPEPETPWELPDNTRYVDELQTFEATSSVYAAATHATIELSTEYAVKGNMVKVTPITDAAFNLTIYFKKDGELLTAWDMSLYEYVQFSVYCEAPSAVMFFFGDASLRIGLVEGKNTVKLNGSTLADYMDSKYTNGAAVCYLDGLTADKALYFDNFIGVYPTNWDPEHPPVKPDPEPEEPDVPIVGDPYPTLDYDMLQTFDEEGGIKGTGKFEVSTEHAVSDKSGKWTVGGPAWAGFQIVLKKNGVALTAEDIAEYEYVQVTIYSESSEAAGLWTIKAKITDIKKGKNVVQIPISVFTAGIEASTAGEIALQMVTPSNSTFVYYFDNFIGVRGDKFAELPADLDYDTLQSFETAETAKIQKTDASSGNLIAGEFENATVTTELTMKNNAVSFDTTKARQQFQVLLTKEDGTPMTVTDLAEYDELWLHVYLTKETATKDDATFQIGSYALEGSYAEGIHILKIDVQELLEAIEGWDTWKADTANNKYADCVSPFEDGWLTVIVTNGGQKYTITVDELLGVRLPEETTDPAGDEQA